MFWVCERSPFVAVILYLPGVRPIWMYSPFLFVFVVSFWPAPSWFSMLIAAPSTGLFSLSTTLPLTCPVWADAGTATKARPIATAQITRLRRIVAPVMESSRSEVS